MAQQSPEMTQQREQEVKAEGLASGDREQRQQRNLWIAMLQRTPKGFMSILPNAIENLRGLASLKIEEYDDQLCILASTFFNAAEASKELVYPNLQQCLSVFEALGDREHLKQWYPDTMEFKLWVVSDSVLTMYNYKGDPQRHVSHIWMDNPQVWSPFITEASFGIRDGEHVLDISQVGWLKSLRA